MAKLRDFTTPERYSKATEIEIQTFNFANGIYSGVVIADEKTTHHPAINMSEGKMIDDCEDFNFNKKVCYHILALLIRIKKTNQTHAEHILSTISAHDTFAKLDIRVPKGFLPTGSQQIDSFLGGGIPFGNFLGWYSDYNVGKSIFCHQVAAVAWKIFKGKTLYIDTERSFVREDVQERVAGWFKQRFDIPDFKIDYRYMSDIFKLINFFGWTLKLRYSEKGKMDSMLNPEQKVLTEGLPRTGEIYKLIAGGGYRLVVLDSITTPTEGIMGSGQEQFPGRKPIYSNILMNLRNLAEIFNVPILVTAHLSKGVEMKSPPTHKGGRTLGFDIKDWYYLKGGREIGPRTLERKRSIGLPREAIGIELKKDWGYE